MAIDLFQTLEVIEVMENFVESIRPPEDIRHKLDLSYTIEDQSIILYETRPKWNNINEIIECNVAKATFVKSRNQWKIYWQREDQKWYSYKPMPFVESLAQFVQTVHDDKHGCFWG